MKTVLQFSGGADSLALLFLLREQWGELAVLWCDTGSAYPGTHDLMERVAALVPNFHTVKSDKAGWSKRNGIAVDVVPIRYTVFGREVHHTPDAPIYTSYIHCCGENIWKPMVAAVKALGATVVLRGQRLTDAKRSPIVSGTVVEGVRYEFPIEAWTREQVLDYCRAECPEFLPDYYATGEESSRDCWDCVAYLEDNRRRIANLPKAMSRAVRERLTEYRTSLQFDLEALDAC